MENKKDIGKAISDKLSTLDKTPRENVWNGISYELQKKKKRRIAFFFFWTRTIGLLLAGVIVAFYIYTQNDGFISEPQNNANESIIKNGNNRQANPEDSKNHNTEINKAKSDPGNITLTEDEDNIEKKNASENKNTFKTGNAVGSNSLNSKKSSSKSTQNNNAGAKNSKAFKNKSRQFSTVSRKKLNKNAKEASKQSGIIAEQNTTALFDPKSLQNNSSIDKTKEISDKKPDSLIAKKDKEMKKKNDLKPEDKTEKDSTTAKEGFVKFYIDAFLSPTHYGFLSNGSTLDRRLDSNSKSTNIEMNYGAGLTYQLTESVAIRIGYSKIKLNYTTGKALTNTPNYGGIEYKPGISNQTIYAASGNAESMDITQQLTYTEIPLEGRYRILDKKIGLNAFAGFSFLILNENSVNIKTNNGFSQNIGKTKGMFDTSISANIGFGVDYQIFRNTKAFMEPTLNYQAISFENSDYKPYYFGLHVGIRYALINK